MVELEELRVNIRRLWNDWRIAETMLSDLSDLHWDRYSGGVNAPCPQYFLHAYVMCDAYKGDLAHSCAHGQGPHSIKVCITKKDNPDVFSSLTESVGPKPKILQD